MKDKLSESIKMLKETYMLDFSVKSIQNLIHQRGWLKKDEFTKIKEIYNFVLDEILFGYNISDNIPASKVYRYLGRHLMNRNVKKIRG